MLCAAAPTPSPSNVFQSPFTAAVIALTARATLGSDNDVPQGNPRLSPEQLPPKPVNPTLNPPPPQLMLRVKPHPPPPPPQPPQSQPPPPPPPQPSSPPP